MFKKMTSIELLLLLLLLLLLTLTLSQVVVLAALASLLMLHDNKKISRMYKSPPTTDYFQKASSFQHNRKICSCNRLINRFNGVLLRQITPLQ